MEKFLFKNEEDFATWKKNESQSYMHPRHSKMILDLCPPSSYPAILAMYWENNPDEGTFLITEFVYPSDFN